MKTRVREVDGKTVTCVASTIYIEEKADEEARKRAFQKRTSKSAIFVEILEKALATGKGA